MIALSELTRLDTSGVFFFAEVIGARRDGHVDAEVNAESIADGDGGTSVPGPLSRHWRAPEPSPPAATTAGALGRSKSPKVHVYMTSDAAVRWRAFLRAGGTYLFEGVSWRLVEWARGTRQAAVLAADSNTTRVHSLDATSPPPDDLEGEVRNLADEIAPAVGGRRRRPVGSPERLSKRRMISASQHWHASQLSDLQDDLDEYLGEYLGDDLGGGGADGGAAPCVPSRPEPSPVAAETPAESGETSSRGWLGHAFCAGSTLTYEGEVTAVRSKSVCRHVVTIFISLPL